MLSGSFSPGTCTRMRSLPWRWMVGSRVPTSSIRRRTISSDWVTAARAFPRPLLGQPDLDPPVADLLNHQLARQASPGRASAAPRARAARRRIGQGEGDDVAAHAEAAIADALRAQGAAHVVDQGLQALRRPSR